MKAIPTISELFNNLVSDLKSKLGIIAVVLKLVFNAFCGVLAGQFKLAYLLLSDIQNNIFPDTADTAANGGMLNRIGQIRLNRQPFPPTDGFYTASVVGVAGSVIRAGLTFKSNDDSTSPGNLYIIDNEYILTGTDDVITLRSLDAGIEFILAVVDGLTPTEPVIGVDDTVLITGITQQPTAAETTELYRQNVLDSYRLLPQGGSKTDYRLWAADAPGVQRVYPYVKQGDAGVVQVFVEATVADSTDQHGTPSDALLTAVEEVINFSPDTTLPTNYRGRRPMQAILEVNPITPIPVDVQITSLQTDTSAVRSNISANLVTFLFGIRPFIAGADLQRDKNNILTAVKLQSVVDDTIGNANTFLGFSLSVDGVSVNTYTFSLSEIPYLRNVTYN